MKRILTAVVVLPFLIASILIPSLWWVFLLLAVAAMVLGLWEFYLLAKRLQLKPDPAAGYIAGAALPRGTETAGAIGRFAGTVAFVGYAVALWQMSIWYRRAFSMTLKATFDGLLYAAVTCAVLIWLWPS